MTHNGLCTGLSLPYFLSLNSSPTSSWAGYPFYWLTKCAFLVWCMSPLDGASTIYHSIVLPWFRKNQGVLDQAVNDGRKKLSSFADQAINAGTNMALNAGDGKKAD